MRSGSPLFICDGDSHLSVAGQAAIEAIRDVLAGALSDDDRCDIEYVLAVHWLNERSWFPAPGAHSSERGHEQLFVNPPSNVVAIINVGDEGLPRPTGAKQLLIDQGYGSLAQSVSEASSRCLSIDIAANRMHETLESGTRSSALWEPDSVIDTSIEIGFGSHPPSHANYRYQRHARNIAVAPQSVSAPTNQVMLDVTLEKAIANPSLDEADIEHLRRSLRSVLAITPTSMGLVGVGNYSGLNSSALTQNLGHKTRAQAFAYELHAVADLIACRSVSDDGRFILQLRPGYERVDFGVRFQGHRTRRSVEADIFITDHHGGRHAIDVKHTAGTHGHPTRLTQPYLDAIEDAIARDEITSFHLLMNTWIRPANAAAIRELAGRGVPISAHSTGLRTTSPIDPEL